MTAQIPGEFSASNLSLFYNSHNPRSQRPLIWHKSVLMKETFSSQLGSGFCFCFFFKRYHYPLGTFLVVQMIKNLPAMRETGVQSPGWEDPLEKVRLPTPVYLPGEFQGQRSLAGYSPWDRKESDMTEQLSFTCHLHYPLKVMSVYLPISTFNFRNISYKPCLHNIKTTKQFR